MEFFEQTTAELFENGCALIQEATVQGFTDGKSGHDAPSEKTVDLCNGVIAVLEIFRLRLEAAESLRSTLFQGRPDAK